MTGFERDRRAGMNRDFSSNEARIRSLCIKTKSNSPASPVRKRQQIFGIYVHVFGSSFACLTTCSACFYVRFCLCSMLLSAILTVPVVPGTWYPATWWSNILQIYVVPWYQVPGGLGTRYPCFVVYIKDRIS